jgi:flagellar protein FliO/FliZ
MTEVLLRVLVVAFVAAAIVAVAVIVRKMMQGPGLTGLLAPKKSQRRLDVVEQTVIDAKRRLVLIRRDNVEHLVMTGGPVDIVIESGIGAAQSATESKTTTSTRSQPPHPLGLAAE